MSIDNNKMVVNSTLTPNMTFTKTSQKFGQWSDARANEVYGLGFSNEAELNKFVEQFDEIKKALGANATSNGAPSSPSQQRLSLNTNDAPDGPPLAPAGDELLGGGAATLPKAAAGNIHQRSSSISGTNVSFSTPFFRL